MTNKAELKFGRSAKDDKTGCQSLEEVLVCGELLPAKDSINISDEGVQFQLPTVDEGTTEVCVTVQVGTDVACLVTECTTLKEASSSPALLRSAQPSSQPSRILTTGPSGAPSTTGPSSQPSMIPSTSPSGDPSTLPSSQPSMDPSSEKLICSQAVETIELTATNYAPDLGIIRTNLEDSSKYSCSWSGPGVVLDSCEVSRQIYDSSKGCFFGCCFWWYYHIAVRFVIH
jgi:hypothetical protein